MNLFKNQTKHKKLAINLRSISHISCDDESPYTIEVHFKGSFIELNYATLEDLKKAFDQLQSAMEKA